MDQQQIVLVAIAIVLGASGLAVLVLAQPLYTTIIDPHRPFARARFWRGYVGLVVILVPLVTTLFSLPARGRTDPPMVIQVAEQVRTPLAALAVTLVLLGPIILLVPGGPGVTVTVTPEQADDLARLLAKVDVIRAREVLRRDAEEVVAFSPSSSRTP